MLNGIHKGITELACRLYFILMDPVLDIATSFIFQIYLKIKCIESGSLNFMCCVQCLRPLHDRYSRYGCFCRCLWDVQCNYVWCPAYNLCENTYAPNSNSHAISVLYSRYLWQKWLFNMLAASCLLKILVFKMAYIV